MLSKKKQEGWRRKIVALPIFVILCLIILFLFKAMQGRTGVHYDFISHFKDAEKINFRENEINDIILDDETYSYSHSYLRNIFIKYLTNNSVFLYQKGFTTRVSYDSVKDGVFRFVFLNKINIKKQYFFKFKEIDSENYWSVVLDLVTNKCFCRIVRVRNGSRETIDEFKYAVKPGKKNVLFVSFFADYLVLLDKDKLLYQQKDQSLNIKGKISFSSSNRSSPDDGGICKFAGIGTKGVEDILLWNLTRHKKIDNHKFNWQDIWNPLHTQSLLYIDGKNYQSLRRVKLDFKAMPAIMLGMNTTLRYRVKVPDSAALEFSLAVVPKYADDLSRLRFRVDIEDSDGGLIKSKVVDFSGFKDTFKTFNPVRIDLKDLSGSDCFFRFSLTTTDGKHLGNEDKISILLASPMIYSKSRRRDLNVILISLDTLRADHLGCYGYKRNTSPNIDELARGGVTFLNTICSANWTIPSHMTIMTGLHPMEVGFVPLGMLSENSFIAYNIATIAEYLRKEGYKTIGVHGGGWISEYYGFDKGFESYIKSHRDIGKAVDLCLDLLSKSKDFKFFLFLHTYEIHRPYMHSDFLKDLHGEISLKEKIIARYDSGIKYTDLHLGRLFLWLKKNNLFEKTVIIVTADHGETFRIINKKSNSGDHGRTLFDDELKVPLIIGGAQIDGSGKKIRYQASTVDILPTILDITGIMLKNEIRGVSLLPFIDGEEKLKPRLAYTEATNAKPKMFSIRSNEYKLIAQSRTVESGYRWNFSKIIFYNLKEDAGETTDISRTQKREVLEYLNYLKKILGSISTNASRIRKVTRPVVVSDEELENQLKALGYLGN